jgi:hypothetical protein
MQELNGLGTVLEISTDWIRVDRGILMLFVVLVQGQEVTGWRQMEPFLLSLMIE